MIEMERKINIKMNNLKKPLSARIMEYVKSQWSYWVMVTPYALLLFAFIYLPMFGLVLAFKNFHIDQGIFGSPWAGWQNFKFFFTSEYAWRATRNTILLNLLFITANHLFALFCSITLFEIRSKWFRGSVQSITFFPSFLSWVVIAVLALGIFETDRGSLNHLLTMFHFQKVNWYSWPQIWPVLLTFIYIWKNAGILIVIYIAALTTINPEYYEAAKIDGAGFWQRIRHVTLPHLAPVVVVLVIMALGNVFKGDVQMMLAIVNQKSQLYPTTDVLDFFVYRSLMNTFDVGMPAAVGLYQSCVGFVLVLCANWLARRYQKDGALF